LDCADRTEAFIAQFDVPKTLRAAGVPREEIGEIVAPIARELQHMGVVDRPVTEKEVLALLESVY
jgi:alcohol dehydrogenase class IV